MSTPAKAHKLDIFDVLKQIDLKKFDLWDSLSEEEQKSVSPIVLLRWLAGTDDIAQLYILNSIANPMIFSVGAKHKGLIMQLFAAAASGKVKRHKWMPLKNDKKTQSKRSISLISDYHKISTREAADVVHLFSHDDLITMATALGWQKDEIKELK